MNSSRELALSSSFGIRLCTGKLVGPSTFRPVNRARMVSFLATSMPFRSSLGSGSVKPASLAFATIWLQLRGTSSSTGEKVLKRYDIVPEKTPSILVTLSPVTTRSFNVDITGRPAPTDDSW